jgi:hypothetical protein
MKLNLHSFSARGCFLKAIAKSQNVGRKIRPNRATPLPNLLCGSNEIPMLVLPAFGVSLEFIQSFTQNAQHVSANPPRLLFSVKQLIGGGCRFDGDELQHFFGWKPGAPQTNAPPDHPTVSG